MKKIGGAGYSDTPLDICNYLLFSAISIMISLMN